ncbi:MAG TPA: class I SAM-dependent methyltransferase [Gaiellaceae bacterium]|nr:class I SAM-dependent methyltransferase [Gaiellaceae bacterium]
MSHPERIVPDETESGVVALHLKRYLFARPWCEGREVLDVACGAGYGTAALADVAARVTGGDVDGETIDYARTRYARDNVEFRVLDATSLPFADESFDTICSFETIEHLDRPDAFVREAARVLRQDGVALVSTPHVERTTRQPANPFHRVELAAVDFEALLRTGFSTVTLYGQRRLRTRRHELLRRLDVIGLRRRSALLRRATVLTGTHATEHATLDEVAITPGVSRDATELVAVCTGPRR